jgi:hypothetical protein
VTFDGLEKLEVILKIEQSERILKLINEKMPNLKHLIFKNNWHWLHDYSEVNFPSKIPQVEILTLYLNPTPSFITKIVGCFTGLRKIIIKFKETIFDLETAKFLILNCQKLEEILIVGENSSLSYEVLEFLLFFESNLKNLTINVENPLKYLGVAKNSLKSKVRLIILDSNQKSDKIRFKTSQESRIEKATTDASSDGFINYLFGLVYNF